MAVQLALGDGEQICGLGERFTPFARSATAGGRRFPVRWGGDCWASFEPMAESLRGGLSLSGALRHRR